ncbi:Transmembrane protein [Phytophthora cinnamomi]|uniref:Transmembrane protein n=1 Tax=Phytophthora cinnamomi TaxID=4785 RepID=UPI00355A1CB7|nr:Transmembrane protein [Phytophthora cinnamomi]
MMQTQPLPTCDEYDPLDAHLDELEEPGANFLQDFIVAPQPTQSDTPLSTSNGYTSEESDYSVVTPSDEQNYQDMSFLQAANTSELVDVVGDLSPGNLTTLAAPQQQQQQQKFAGKVIKGKTSKYRGVTQTSKTSWGAKYSAKRITNTCKTPEEAAHAYDDYLKANYPQKFAKFANFCDKCSKFVNPLGLPQFRSECQCAASSPTGSSTPGPSAVSPKKEIFNRQQITTPTAATPSLVPPTAPSPGGGPSATSNALNMMGTSTHSLDLNPADEENAAFLSRRSSNLSVGSLKFSFSEDTEQFFAESFNDVAKISSDRGGAALVDEQQQQQQDQKRDSLPMAVISSAVDSFTQEDNLDQIIKDINRSSSSHSLLKTTTSDNDSMGSFTATGSSSGSGKMSELAAMNNLGGVQVEPTTANSLDFDVDELDELTKYFLSENDAAAVVQREMQSNPALMQQNPAMMGAQNHQFKKIHSLDYDSENAMTGSSRGGIVMSEVKMEDTEMMNPFMMPPAANAAMIMPPGSPPPAIIEIQTRFLEKYWRNDRKNIQCFPYCPEHGDYYRVRIENLQHRCKGVCRAAVKAHVSIPAPAGTSVVQPGLLVLARCNSTFSRNMTLSEQQLLNMSEMKSLQGVSAVGVIDNFAPLGNGARGVQFDVTFHPDVWKFEFDLPKKRRHVQSSSPAVSTHGTDGDGNDPLAAEFLYFFEIDVFSTREKTTFERLGHTESINFQIGNTRTLLRQRNKMVEEFNSSGGPQAHATQNDNDKLMDADEMPEKKKVKINLNQQEFRSGTSVGEDSILSSRGLTGRKLSLGYITGEGISSTSKRNLLEDKTAALDVDGYFRADSKDSLFDHEAGTSDLPEVKTDVWKDVDGASEDQQTATADYRSYVSPKQKTGNVQAADSPIATAIPIKPSSNARAAIPASSTKTAYSLPKLLGYSFACVPLSVLFIPVGILLLLGFLVVPPAASGIVSALDALSDMELSRANSSCTSQDQRLVLNRLVEEKVDSNGKPKGGLFRYHGKGEVWGRIFYFSGAKFVVSMVSLIPTCALWSREFTRETTGKPLTGGTQYDEVGGLV